LNKEAYDYIYPYTDEYTNPIKKTIIDTFGIGGNEGHGDPEDANKM